ncbi:hypothetical protein HELRODRAFT_176528 [Helobdella robusta]|uniref:Uncharacterized protein n=1 Tax=Helobdella robusta TaxID=6412 RepID=T1FAM4_HELRO|nr:hypothetical protein HELRODRAFT_176528 [Helobdella robusta]ESN99766.1 hypothetical protein HELRODRAFT_176528 [Helobdella robusta]
MKHNEDDGDGNLFSDVYLKGCHEDCTEIDEFAGGCFHLGKKVEQFLVDYLQTLKISPKLMNCTITDHHALHDIIVINSKNLTIIEAPHLSSNSTDLTVSVVVYPLETGQKLILYFRLIEAPNSFFINGVTKVINGFLLLKYDISGPRTFTDTPDVNRSLNILLAAYFDDTEYNLTVYKIKMKNYFSLKYAAFDSLKAKVKQRITCLSVGYPPANRWLWEVKNVRGEMVKSEIFQTTDESIVFFSKGYYVVSCTAINHIGETMVAATEQLSNSSPIYAVLIIPILATLAAWIYITRKKAADKNSGAGATFPPVLNGMLNESAKQSPGPSEWTNPGKRIDSVLSEEVKQSPEQSVWTNPERKMDSVFSTTSDVSS